MQFCSIFLTLSLALFKNFECRMHGYGRLMRQGQQIYFPPNQAVNNPYPVQPMLPQTSPNINPYIQTIAPVIFTSAAQPLANPTVANAQAPPSTYIPPVQNLANAPAVQYPQNPTPPAYAASSSYDMLSRPPAYVQQRRRKDVAEKKNTTGKLLEHGKNLLELSTIKENIDDGLNSKNNDTLRDNEMQTTVVPIPNGVQLKKFSKNGKHIVETLNVTSSTQKTLSFGNSTEIENIVEMHMEKEIENAKGDKEGSEEVRIVETERVKPLLNKKGNVVSFKKRKRKSYSRMTFETHHRSKRNKAYFESRPRSKATFRKIARHLFPSRIRKERVVDSDLLNRGDDMEAGTNGMRKRVQKYEKFANSDHKTTEEYGKVKSNDRGGDIESFINFFIRQMVKYRKSRENKKNETKPAKYLDFDKRVYSDEISKYKLQRALKNLDYPERMIMNLNMHVIMNLNMPWVDKGKELNGTPKRCEKHEVTAAQRGKSTTSLIEASTKELEMNTPIASDKDNGLRFLGIILLFASIASVFAYLLWNLGKLYRFGRVASGYRTKTYRLHHDDDTERIQDLESSNKNIVFTGDYPQMEWQCESGDWLSDKENNIK